jgi:hypothetical protein
VLEGGDSNEEGVVGDGDVATGVVNCAEFVQGVECFCDLFSGRGIWRSGGVWLSSPNCWARCCRSADLVTVVPSASVRSRSRCCAELLTLGLADLLSMRSRD